MIRTIYGHLHPFPYSNSKYYLYLFLLWPFLALITAIINYSQKDSRKVVYLFLFYYGLCFVLGNTGQDAARYALSLRNYATLPYSEFFKIVGGLYTSDSSVDVVEPFITFLISRVTSHHSLLFAVFAAVFGYFYLKSINLLHDRYRENAGINALIFMTFFTLTLPITAINGFRMWTAAWIFFYGAYHVILYRKTVFLFIALASSLVHWSFITANAILLIYFFVGNRKIVYGSIAVASFVVPQLLKQFFQRMAFTMGGSIQNRYEGYSNEEYMLTIKQSNENVSWFMGLSDLLVFYYLIVTILIVTFKKGGLMNGKAEKNLFSFLLLFLSFVNFGKAIPSFGERFQVLFYLFATLYIFLYFIKRPETKIHFLTVIGVFPMVLYSLIVFRIGSESISAWLLTPGFGIPLLEPSLSIAHVLFY